MEATEDTASPEDGTADTTTASGPLIIDGDSTTATTNRGTTSNPDATTAQPIGCGGDGSNIATIAIAVVYSCANCCDHPSCRHSNSHGWRSGVKEAEKGQKILHNDHQISR